jgi:hypothetical protein
LVLQNLEATVVGDVQSTVRMELTDLLRTGVLSTGSEFRCGAEFLRLRAEGELRRIRNELAMEANQAGVRPPIPLLIVPPARPAPCSATPLAVDLSLDPSRNTVALYGP